MGGAGSKKLPKEDMQFLIDNTNFSKQQIKAWYKGFMVSYYVIYIINNFFKEISWKIIIFEKKNNEKNESLVLELFSWICQ